MFHKEHSSTSDQGGKKGKDVALRKSDRKSLLQRAREVLETQRFAVHNNNNDPSAFSLQSLLDDAFLRGNLLRRHLKLPTCNVHLYYRSPSESSSVKDETNATSSSSGNGTITNAWPYRCQTQCIWLQLELEKGRGTIDLPGLALLAALTVTTPSGVYHFPTVVTVPWPVSKFVCRGANLMRAGMLNVPCTTTATTTTHANSVVVAVCVQGNPQPFAVGLLHPDLLPKVNTATATTSALVGAGTHGLGVTVVHAYGDDLWRQQLTTSAVAVAKKLPALDGILNCTGGSLYDAGHYGNVGFVDGQYVAPIDDVQECDNEATMNATTSDNECNEPLTSHESDRVTTDADAAIEVDPCSSDTVDASTNNVIPLTEFATTEGVMAKTNLSSNNATRDEQPSCGSEQGATRSPEEILHDAVCSALASLNVKKDLPMKMATFYAQFVLPNRVAEIQLKQTKYKKFSAYITEQVEAGLITVGPDSNTKDTAGVLTGYDRRNHDMLKYLEARKLAMAEEATDDMNSSHKKLILADLYCIPNHCVALLRLDRDDVQATQATSLERRNTGMLTVKEVRAILDNYIVREELVTADRPDQVLLDGPLTDAFYKKKKKKSADTSSNGPTPMALSRKDIVALWLACLEPAYALVQMPGNVILKLGRGKPPVVKIEVSRRQSNKFVTRVFGLEPFGVDAEALSKDVAHRFACSATVTPAATTNGTTEVLVQGNLADELEALLLSDETLTTHGGAKGSTYHLPKNSVDVVLRKGVPARKKRNTGSKKPTI